MPYTKIKTKSTSTDLDKKNNANSFFCFAASVVGTQKLQQTKLVVVEERRRFFYVLTDIKDVSE